MELRPSAGGARWTPAATGRRTRRSARLSSHLCRTLICALLGLAVCAVPARAADNTAAGGSAGVFAKVDIEAAIKRVTADYEATHGGRDPKIAQLHGLLQQLYGTLLHNHAVVGL